MRVLVTGSSGFVGGWITRHLQSLGCEVVGLNRRPSGSALDIAVDLADSAFLDSVASATRPCEAIVHAAARIDTDPLEPAVTLANALGTQHVLNLARRWKCTQFVYLSSIGVIGTPRDHPLTEQHPTSPLTVYHASKLYGEHLTAIATGNGLSACALRLTSPVGPGMPRNRILSVFVRRASANQPLQVAGRGTRQQDYIDVRDIGPVVQACLERRATGCFNLGSGRGISNVALAQTCIRVLGSRSAVELGGRPDPEEGLRWDVSIERAAATLGHAPRYRIEDSIIALETEIATRSTQ